MTSFEELTRKIAVRKRIPLIRAAYLVLDQLTIEEVEDGHVCQKGCSACCNQMIFCSSMEIAEIMVQIKKIPRERRSKLIERLKVAAREWQDHPSAAGEDQLDVAAKWMGMPCPFLDEAGVCTIYEARPIDCRGHFSHVLCAVPDQSGSFQTQASIDASGYIVSIQEKSRQPIGVTPIRHWLAECFRTGLFK